MSSVPRFGDVGILAIVPDRWGPPWMPRHQVLKRLARYFHVVWVGPQCDWRTLWLKKDPCIAATASLPTEAGFQLYEPSRWLPVVYRPGFAAQYLQQVRLKQALKVLTRCRARRVILYVWRPEFAPALELIPHELSVYHIDDEYSFSEVELPVDPVEQKLIESVDQVIVHSPALKEKKGKLNPNTAVIPNGVDYAAYSTESEMPRDLSRVPSPRLGYVGVIKSQLDFELLRSVAAQKRDCSLVLVGPRGYLGAKTAELKDLLRIDNVYYLGPKPLESLPAYTQHMDVCLLPYAINDYTKFIYPLKLHEYLATGRPVVGVPIRSLIQFSDVVFLADGPEEWSEALTSALHPEARVLSQIDLRRRVAAMHDWNLLVARIAELMCRHLGAPCIHQFQTSSSSEM